MAQRLGRRCPGEEGRGRVSCARGRHQRTDRQPGPGRQLPVPMAEGDVEQFLCFTDIQVTILEKS